MNLEIGKRQRLQFWSKQIKALRFIILMRNNSVLLELEEEQMEANGEIFKY